MFILRGIAVSLTSFVLVYGLLSLMVAGAWRAANLLRQTSARRRADLLFWLRTLPLLASSAITIAFVIPAYVRLEPRSIDEDIALPIVLGVTCLALFAIAVARVVTAHQKTARVIANWLNGANVVDAGVNARTFQTNREAPPLTLVGVCAPRIVVSEATVAVLNRDELRVAVQHEIAHIHSRDNLKKLIFHCSPFPGMAGLESAWHEAAELAADDQAVSNAGEALDLAAALIKLTRNMPARATADFAMALVDGGGLVSNRVKRLLAWQGNALPTTAGWVYFILPLSISFVAAAMYFPLLTRIHTITEWLVR